MIRTHNVYYFTDIHGKYEIFSAIRNWCKQQDPECTIIYGGDAADRGPDGYKIIKELLSDPQIIYLYGNHEELFVRAADELIGQHACSDAKYKEFHSHTNENTVKTLLETTTTDNVFIHMYNEGYCTLRDWILDGANEDLIDALRRLPRTFSYEYIDFCHAGSVYSLFQEAQNCEYFHQMIPYSTEQDIIWNRSMLALGWETGRICVHGHSPTILLPASVYGRDKSIAHIHPCAWQDQMGKTGLAKRGGWKIDMDTATAFSGRTYVINCLTMEVTGFQDKNIHTGDSPDIEIFEQYQII